MTTKISQFAQLERRDALINARAGLQSAIAKITRLAADAQCDADDKINLDRDLFVLNRAIEALS